MRYNKVAYYGQTNQRKKWQDTPIMSFFFFFFFKGNYELVIPLFFFFFFLFFRKIVIILFMRIDLMKNDASNNLYNFTFKKN
jgi:hypothetical protein